MRKLDNITTKDFKQEINAVESEGMKEIIKRVFQRECGFNPLPLCYSTYIGDHRGLTYQDNETEIEEGVRLSSFAITEDEKVVAVCFDEEDKYVFYEL